MFILLFIFVDAALKAFPSLVKKNEIRLAQPPKPGEPSVADAQLGAYCQVLKDSIHTADMLVTQAKLLAKLKEAAAEQRDLRTKVSSSQLTGSSPFEDLANQQVLQVLILFNSVIV
jgi:hypothetical protein